MAARLDPRAWNLLAGFGLVAGACSGRTIGSDDTGNADTGNADTNESGVSSETQGTSNPETSSETDPDSSTESESDDSQCNQNSDCPPGYYCVGGMCEYYEAPDGGPWYECYESNECEALSLCVYDSCESVSALPDCAANSESSIPLAVDDAPQIGRAHV